MEGSVPRVSNLWREEIGLAEPLSGLQAGPPAPVDCEQPTLTVLGQNLVAVAPSDLTKDYF